MRARMMMQQGIKCVGRPQIKENKYRIVVSGANRPRQ